MCYFNRRSMGSVFLAGGRRLAWSLGPPTPVVPSSQSTSMLCSASFHILFGWYIVPVDIRCAFLKVQLINHAYMFTCTIGTIVKLKKRVPVSRSNDTVYMHGNVGIPNLQFLRLN